MLAVMALEDHGLKPGAGEVLVTGAAGGVGSVAVAVLAQLGYQGRRLDRAAATRMTICAASAPPPSSTAPSWPSRRSGRSTAERWAGAIDAVGSTTLANVLTQLSYRGSRRRLRPRRRQRSAGHASFPSCCAA